jgi:hypothetical protein
MIKDLGLIRMIDARRLPDAQAEITPGEAVAGMILNGLGVANRPLSLTPPFCANNPLDRLFRAGVEAPMFHRFKLVLLLFNLPTKARYGILPPGQGGGYGQENLSRPIDGTSTNAMRDVCQTGEKIR